MAKSLDQNISPSNDTPTNVELKVEAKGVFGKPPARHRANLMINSNTDKNISKMRKTIANGRLTTST